MAGAERAADLVDLVPRATYLFEILQDNQLVGQARHTRAGARQVGGECALVDRWTNAISATGSVAGWDRYSRELGLDVAGLREALRDWPAMLPDSDPAWAVLVRRIVAGIGGPADRAVHLGNTPFGELWHPFVDVFSSRLGSPCVTWRLSGPARDDLLKGLAGELGKLGLRVAFARFTAYRSERLGPLAPFASPRETRLYRAYVRSETSDGRAGLFGQYPVLARRLATSTLSWCSAQAEMLARLAADLPRLTDLLFDGIDPGRIVGIVPAAGDVHHSGRATAAIAFESGVRLVYKPRPLDIEFTVNRFLSELMREGAPVDFRILRVVPRGSYGWMEYAAPTPCPDPDSAGLYYHRLGALLAVLYALHGTDLHAGNLIASEGFPVGVDYECLLSGGPAILSAGAEHTVLDVGILPSGEADRPDLTALGARGRQVGDWLESSSRDANTDVMTVVEAPRIYESAMSMPTVGTEPTDPTAWRMPMVQGFERTYRFLMRCRDDQELVQRLLPPFREPVVRLLVRNSRYYAALLQAVSTVPFQRDGISFSLGVEQLARAYVDRIDDSAGWCLLTAERSALLRGEIPIFRLKASERALHAEGETIQGLLRETPFEATVRRFEGLDERDLARQVRLIQRALT